MGTWKNLIATSVLILGCTIIVSAHKMKEQPCIGEQYEQLDFWVGTWDLRWGEGDEVKGRNVISKSLNDCAIEENFNGLGNHPLRGKSVSMYDKTVGMWRQTWVDNTGSYLEFTGGPVEDVFILSRTSTVGNKQVEQRMTFYNISENAFDWDWEVSNDNGLTWKLRWRIHYTRVQED